MSPINPYGQKTLFISFNGITTEVINFVLTEATPVEKEVKQSEICET